MEWLLVALALWVAFSNGANDNFKGFATLWGTQALSYGQALKWATIATVAGSLTSVFLAQTLIHQFSGSGLVPDAVVRSPLFMVSVASGAAITVFLATRLGFPVSTTHALIGGLVGAGLGLGKGEVHFATLTGGFLAPMLISPLVAAVLGALSFQLFRLRRTEHDCACVVPLSSSLLEPQGAILSQSWVPGFVVASHDTCAPLATPMKWSISRGLEHLHFFSAMAICFARGVNDTPKLAALLLAAHQLGAQAAILAIVLVMALGGVLFARRVAETMSQRVTRMDPTQGIAANLITAFLVLFASKFGLPVSTTHVAVGSIAGVGASAKTIDWSSLRNILLSWVATLPLAAMVAWGVGKLI